MLHQIKAKQFDTDLCFHLQSGPSGILGSGGKQNTP